MLQSNDDTMGNFTSAFCFAYVKLNEKKIFIFFFYLLGKISIWAVALWRNLPQVNLADNSVSLLSCFHLDFRNRKDNARNV